MDYSDIVHDVAVSDINKRLVEYTKPKLGNCGKDTVDLPKLEDLELQPYLGRVFKILFSTKRHHTGL